MTTDVIMAGFGGQGILMIGNLLALAAMEEGRNVTYFPAYGVEMRGGTANCTVVISDEEIGSPAIGHPKACVVMNGPSLDRYLPLIRKRGNLIINGSLVDPAKVTRRDLEVLAIPANDIARKSIGSQQLASMVALGAYVAVTGVVGMQTLFDCLPKVVSKKFERFIPLNVNALKEGESFARNHP
ncbi:MAG: 2-oxoacid:acceptor oxidoreductase family protein [Deltaproteobacteria bacterium]|nr:MAG: 2-oxoacid:acceptor oxidoreductase family protein [Deltaproteobacteria bacterium]